jgi:hypothetical protein
MSDALTFAFAGDLLLGGEWPDCARKHGRDILDPFDKVLPVISDADVFFVNLEGPIFDAATAPTDRRGATLANHRSVVSLLKRARKCVCVLANNHLTDFGADGIAQTRAVLKREGILCVGAGHDAAEAEQSVIFQSKGKTIGCLAFASDDQDVSSVIAGSSEAGCAGMRSITRIEAAIQKLKTQCDIVVVSLHWGIEFFRYPSAEQVSIAERLAKAGADFLMGHHPHVLQGIEQSGSCLTLYSLGHFFVPPFRRNDGEMIRPKPASREFAIVVANVGEKRSFEVFGGAMDNNFVLQPYDDRGQRALREKLNALAPSRVPTNYNEFSKQYYSARLKQLQSERKIETLAGFVREPVKELKRRLAARSSARTCSV